MHDIVKVNDRAGIGVISSIIDKVEALFQMLPSLKLERQSILKI
jgi:hypothetical protein